jgi:hypothetical protein
VSDVFSGPENFFYSYAPQADPAGLIDRSANASSDTNHHQKWSTGGPIQSPLVRWSTCASSTVQPTR